MKHRSQTGVTLIELMISITLMSLLALGILLALRTGVMAMERTNQRMIANRKVVGVERVLHAQLAGFMPVKVNCNPSPQSGPTPALYFQGEPQIMRFVSSYSLEEAARGSPRILVYQVISGENGEGVRLIVNEQIYTGPHPAAPECFGLQPDPQTGFPRPQFTPVQAGNGSFVLADRIAYCRFSFKRLLPDGTEIWVPRWSFKEVPAALRIDMAPLAPDPAKLQVLAMTVPFRVNRIWDAPYDQ